MIIWPVSRPPGSELCLPDTPQAHAQLTGHAVRIPALPRVRKSPALCSSAQPVPASSQAKKTAGGRRKDAKRARRGQGTKANPCCATQKKLAVAQATQHRLGGGPAAGNAVSRAKFAVPWRRHRASIPGVNVAACKCPARQRPWVPALSLAPAA
jgi:hypothetical protein